MSLILATIGALAAVPLQQVEKTGVCTTRVERSERYRTRTQRITEYYFEYRNNCAQPIRVYYCKVYSTDPSACTLSMYQAAELGVGGRVDVHGPDGIRVHVIECRQGEALVERRSRVLKDARPVCASDNDRAAPEANPSASFTGIGDTPDPALPRATPRPGPMWITADDYPPAMLRLGAEGRSVVALAIDASGAVTGCKVTQSSGFAALDEATCRALMRRARFRPARDAAGNPVRGVYTDFKMAWAIP